MTVPVVTPPHSQIMADYWGTWFALLVTSFLVPEIWMLAAGRPQDTLSAQIWRLEAFVPGQAVPAWNAFHVLFAGALLVFDVWLLAHFTLGWWR